MKKKILIIGYSSFVRRRVIKSLNKIKNLEIYICSKSYKVDYKKRIFFNDYEKTALKVNVLGGSSRHTQVVKKTFNAGIISLFPGGPTSTAPILISNGGESAPELFHIIDG